MSWLRSQSSARRLGERRARGDAGVRERRCRPRRRRACAAGTRPRSTPRPSRRPRPRRRLADSRAAARAPAPSMSVTTTQPPSSANARATALPMPPAPPVIRTTMPCELARRRGERELVELERPVLDPERLLVVEGDEAAERGGAAHDRDRPQVEVARELRGLRASARPPTRPSPRSARRAGSGRAARRRRLRSARSRRARAPGRRGRTRPVARASAAASSRSGSKATQSGRAFGVHEVVGAGSADLGEPGRVASADELEHRRGAVELEHARPIHRERSAQRRQHIGEEPVSLLAPSGARCTPPKASVPCRACSSTNAAARLIVSSVEA